MKNCVTGDLKKKLHNLSISTVSALRPYMQMMRLVGWQKGNWREMSEILSSHSVISKTVFWNVIYYTQLPLFQGCDAVKFCRQIPTFQRNMIHLSYSHDGADSRSIQNVDTYLQDIWIYNVSVKHNNFFNMLFYYLGQHVVTLTESSSGPSKTQILT